MPAVVRIATTTSVENSGLLAAILPAFERAHNIKVEVLAVGGGRALNLLERGEVTVALTHDPKAESAALTRRIATDYAEVLFNDFVLVGPLDNPAEGAPGRNGLRRHGSHRRERCGINARGDASGAYSREQELGRSRGSAPPHRLLETGQGMGATLRVASERAAYTLTNRATFEQLQGRLRLALLLPGSIGSAEHVRGLGELRCARHGSRVRAGPYHLVRRRRRSNRLG